MIYEARRNAGFSVQKRVIGKNVLGKPSFIEIGTIAYIEKTETRSVREIVSMQPYITTLVIKARGRERLCPLYPYICNLGEILHP
jgi:hypothetical protein